MEDLQQHLRAVSETAGLRVPEVVAPEGRHVVVGGFRLHYLDWGTVGRPPILFLHGGGLTAHTWDVVCLALRRHRHCLALDLRGHGDSEWSPELDYGLDAHLRDIAAFADLLKLDRFVIVGQSLGALAAIRYAARQSDRLAGLVTVDAGPYVQRGSGAHRIAEFMLAPGELGSVEEFVERAMAFNPHRDPRLLRRSLRHNLRRLPDGRWTWKYDRRHLSRERFAEFLACLPDLLPEAEAITCPTLVVRGAESEVVSDEDASAFANLVADGRWVRVDGAGHNVQGDYPKALVEALVPFLEMDETR